MRTSLAILRLVAMILIMMFIVIACEMLPVPVTMPPTPISSSTAIATAASGENPTSCMGGYTWAYGTVPPEFITQVQDAMTASGLDGSVQASTFGENDGCGEYHAADVDYVFTVHVQSLEASEDLSNKASIVLDIAKRFVSSSPAPNLGKLLLTFQAEDGQQCQWSYSEGAWNSGGSGEGNFTICPAPVSEESQRLTEVLNALSVDLACETSNVTTNSLQAVLECERPEENNRYIVTVTLRLNEQGDEGSCFHGYNAFEFSSTGDEPMTVTDGANSYFERDRTFQWTANGILYDLFERIKGGPDVTFPLDIHEKVYQRALQDGLIPGEGRDCQ